MNRSMKIALTQTKYIVLMQIFNSSARVANLVDKIINFVQIVVSIMSKNAG